MLWAFLTGEPDEWVDRTITVTASVQKRQEFRQAAKPMSRGELIQKIGEEEAIRNINNHKYDIMYDSDDEPLYVKKEKTWTSSSARTEQASSSRTLRVSINGHKHASSRTMCVCVCVQLAWS